jgi:hypothetical protein
MKMTRYGLAQTLEMIFPNSSDKDENDAWFFGESDEGYQTVVFKIDEDKRHDELELSYFEMGYLTSFYFREALPAYEKDPAFHDGEDETFWIGVQVKSRMFDLALSQTEQGKVYCMVYECDELTDAEGNNYWAMNWSKCWHLKEGK